jgi:hypothetical protein
LIVTNASYLLRVFATWIILAFWFKNYVLPIFVLFNMYALMYAMNTVTRSLRIIIQCYSICFNSLLISNHWQCQILLFRFCLSYFFYLFIYKFCRKCMTVYLSFNRFSRLFLIYSRLNSLPCITWNHYK